MARTKPVTEQELATGAYAGAIDSADAAMARWMTDTETTPDKLPASCWDLPKDCPLWSMGLSMAQAGGVLAKHRRSLPGANTEA